MFYQFVLLRHDYVYNAAYWISLQCRAYEQKLCKTMVEASKVFTKFVKEYLFSLDVGRD